MFAAVLAVAAIALVWLSITRGLASRAVDPETRLLRACHGDREQAERLIAGEISRVPGISRPDAARRALQIRRRDNR